MSDDLVFLLDVDNTLLDNDTIIADLRSHHTQAFGEHSARYWAHFEAIRQELGYADYLGTLQRYRADVEAAFNSERCLFAASAFLIDYPFAQRLYPQALDVLEALRRVGPTVIVSDGDVVFQPRKVRRSVMVDDKVRLLDAMKRVMGAKLTSLFVRQGHYAHDPANVARYLPADRSLERIGDLLALDIAALGRPT
jgi:FMN phosphatase YigB (HAD superfamily)